MWNSGSCTLRPSLICYSVRNLRLCIHSRFLFIQSTQLQNEGLKSKNRGLPQPQHALYTLKAVVYVRGEGCTVDSLARIHANKDSPSRSSTLPFVQSNFKFGSRNFGIASLPGSTNLDFTPQNQGRLGSNPWISPFLPRKLGVYLLFFSKRRSGRPQRLTEQVAGRLERDACTCRLRSFLTTCRKEIVSSSRISYPLYSMLYCPYTLFSALCTQYSRLDRANR